MRFVLLALIAFSTASWSEGPGSRIRAGPAPTPPQPPSPAAERDYQRCAAMRSEDKERCMKNLRAAAAAREKLSGTTSGAAPR